MNRKDIVIVAVLLNAGLLALILLFALQTDGDYPTHLPVVEQVTLLPEKPKLPQVEIQPVVPIQVVSGDEVDDLLKEYVVIAPPLEQPAPKTEPKTAVNPNGPSRLVEVTVKKGDVLDKIARANGTSVEAIKKANSLASEKLTVGQVLKIPVPKSSESSAVAVKEIAQVAAPVPATAPEYYTVKSGDNPWKIAKQFNVKFDDLLKLNNLDEARARNLKVGDRIRVK